MFEPVRGGTRGGQAEFKWSDVSADKDRENYLGHSINAPTGRWQKNKDVHWYSREVAQAEAERIEEIKKIKELEADALAVALGFEPAKKTAPATASSPTASRAADASPSASTRALTSAKSEPKNEQRALEKEERRKKKAEHKEEKRIRKELRRLERDRPHRTIDDGRRHAVDRSRSRSPRGRARSPHRRSISPRRRTISPRRLSRSPHRRPVSPRRPPRLDGRDHDSHRVVRGRSGSRTPSPPRGPRGYSAAGREAEREWDRKRWEPSSRRDRSIPRRH